MNDMNEIFGEVISTYTRADALRDGVLVGVDREDAESAGFRVPVAVTNAVWVDCVEWTEADTARKGVAQNEPWRLRHLLSNGQIACHEARRTDATRVEFDIGRVDRMGSKWLPETVKLVAAIGPGDVGEPVITIGFAEDF